MTDPNLGKDVLDFIGETITSIEQVEVMLLLRKTSPRLWSAKEMAAELASSVLSIENRLWHLKSLGLAEEVKSGEEYRFRYQNGPRDEIVDRLARAYAERRVSVIQAIFPSRPSGPQAIGDAFLLRGKDKPK